MTVENTDQEAYWLTNHLETLLSHVWAPSTVATISLNARRLFRRMLDETAETDAGLLFMLHDFGFRGVSSVESAGREGAGHLVHFLGTDTLQAIETARIYYSADLSSLAFSVAATEHSVMTACGAEGEADLVQNLLEKHPSGILSVVGDSYDIEHFTRHLVGERFRDCILSRDGVFVLRPDSGDPVEVSGRLLDILEELVGCSLNSKGYKVLPPQLRMLWGDGLVLDTVEKFLEAAKNKGWSSENFVFGMGGGLLQRINRDNQCFAMKCSAQKRNGVWHDVWKRSAGGKASKAGKLGLEHAADGSWTTFRLDEPGHEDILQTVFENGVLVREETFEQIRERAARFV
jgi:nicotinamide phosphoribosyltransferase